MPSLATLSVAALSALLGAAAAPPSAELAPFNQYTGQVNDGRYVVLLKSGTDKDSHFSWARSKFGFPMNVSHGEWNPNILHGYAASLDQVQLATIRSSNDVESVYNDGIARIAAPVTQTRSPWGLQRISQAAQVRGNAYTLNFTYKYDATAGAGVDIYIIDTGINSAHIDFRGRIGRGAYFGPWKSTEDDNGHGTRCAGTAGGTIAGVAKQATLVPVKVLGGQKGAGSLADVISGVNFVYNQVRVSRRPSVASMSLGGDVYTPLDSAVDSLVGAGVHVAVAAGNDHRDCSLVSPARAVNPITVAATDINDVKADFSNFGAPVDIWAPGVAIFSAWIGSPTAGRIIDGTSMATPHVAGALATTIGRFGNAPPATVRNYIIRQLALRGIIKGVPAGTVNTLLRNEQS